MITIVLSIIAIIISIVSISFHIYSWIKNKKDNSNLELIRLLANIFEKYNNLEYNPDLITKTDENIEKYTIKFVEHYEKYLLEIINNLKINNNFLLTSIICNNCHNNYQLKELLTVLNDWKFKNTYKYHPHMALMMMKLKNKGKYHSYKNNSGIWWNI